MDPTSESEPDMPLPQVLELQPYHDLYFSPRSRDPERFEATLVLRNPTERPVYFRTMTTAQGRCHVMPSRGLLNPGASTSILVRMRGLEADSWSHEGLMVQSMMCNDPNQDAFSAWMFADPEDIMTSVLNCKYDPAEGSRLQPRAGTHCLGLRSLLFLLFVLSVVMAIIAAYVTDNITFSL